MVQADPERIAVILLRQIGDVLLVTPALAALRQRFPGARIIAVVNDFTAPMLEQNPDIDGVWIYRRNAGSSWRTWYEGLALAMKIRRERFDVALDLTNGDRAAWFSWISRAPRRLAFLPGPSRLDWRRRCYTEVVPRPDRVVHQVERHLLLFSRLGPMSRPGSLVLRLSESERAWARKQKPSDSRPVAVAHLVANWLFKCWEDEKAAEVIDWMQSERGFHVWLTCGPAAKEVERARRIYELCQIKPQAWVGNLGLRQLAALIAESRIFIGVDSAPMHMAAALKVPLVAMFGPTDKTRWRPWSETATVLSGPCPCVETRQKLCVHNALRDCLRSISVAQVQTAVDRCLKTVF